MWFLFTWFHFNNLKIHHLSSLCNNFQFSVIWYTQSMAKLVIYWRLAESDITVKPSVMCTVGLRRWYNHMADTVLPSTALALLQKMSDTHKSTSATEGQVKNLLKEWRPSEKFVKGNQYWTEIRCNKPTWKRCTLDSLIVAYVQFVIMLTELHEALGLELKCLSSKTTTVLLELYGKLRTRVSYIFPALEINK